MSNVRQSLMYHMESVYRWTFENIDDKRNFQSQYHKNPRRFQMKSDKEKCMALALSMFDNLEGAKERFSELYDDIGINVYQIIGSKIAKGSITINSGVNGQIERLGHFNHHPATEIPIISSFHILEKVKI